MVGTRQRVASQRPHQVLESQLERQLMMPARQSLPLRGDGNQGEGQELEEVKSLRR